jgi:hypothetical protein
MQRPSADQLWQIPERDPCLDAFDLSPLLPLDAQEASYLALSTRISSFLCRELISAVAFSPS